MLQIYNKARFPQTSGNTFLFSQRMMISRACWGIEGFTNKILDVPFAVLLSQTKEPGSCSISNYRHTTNSFVKGVLVPEHLYPLGDLELCTPLRTLPDHDTMNFCNGMNGTNVT